MKSKVKYILGILVICCVILVGCGKSTAPKKKPQLTGIYQIDEKYRDKDDQGRVQSNYARFTKNGKVEMAQPETGDDDNGYFGTAYRGTWKHLKGKKFKVHIKSVYDSEEFDLTFVKDSQNKIHSLTNHSGKFDWDADSWTRDTSMTTSDFESLFSKALSSCQEKVKENGTDDPDNDSSSSEGNSNGTDENTSTQINSADEAIAAVKKKYDPEGNINWSWMQTGNDGMEKDENGNEYYWIRGQDKNYTNGGAGSYDGHDYYVYPDGTIKDGQ